jgi:DNA-binding XRE family transcriptional regulator
MDDNRTLQIDHKRGGGMQEAKHFGGASPMYKYYLKHIEEANENLQILCANCNWIKRFEKAETRKEKPVDKIQPKIDLRPFGHRIRILRKKNNLTQKALATQLGCTTNYVWMIEKGLRLPSPQLCQQLSEILQKSKPSRLAKRLLRYRLNGKINTLEDDRAKVT